MNSRNYVFLVAFCAFTHCADYASVSHPAAQQSVDARATHPGASKDNRPAERGPAHSRHLTGKIPLPAHASTVKANRSKLARNNRASLKTRSLGADPKPTSIEHIAAGMAATNRNSLTQPVASSGIGGGNLRNRHLIPVPGSIGGPARTRQNTATLSGTAMGRKHLN